MQVLKKVLIYLVVTVSMAVVSTSAFSAPKGEEAVKEAIENTLSGITAAQTEIKAGN
jgi:ABC-type transporter MlaC component